tara:strand:+ start:100 stop:498 length:399 start_codon:yes stop_codon:yes gene_type:complete
MNKEEKREYDKKRYLANKEKYAANNKAWENKNKEKRAAEKKVYYQENKKKIDVKNKTWYDDKKDGLYTVYYLVNENYVGQTHNLYQRLICHKSKGRDVYNIEVIGKYKTRKEAKTVEAEYHSKGYLGCNNGL